MEKKIWSFAILLIVSFVITTTFTPKASQQAVKVQNVVSEKPLTIGYSNWAGWWPWAIAEQEGLFSKNGADVELRWYDDYSQSIGDFAAGVIDGNSQTLSDTISVAEEAVNSEVVVLVNDFSAGNDKIIGVEGVNSISDLEGKKVALEVGVVDDFLFSLALEKEGMSREDVNLIDLETGAAVAAFLEGEADAVGAFPPFWLEAMQLKNSKELVSSKDFPGAISDLLVVSENLIKDRPEQVQALVNTWFDTLDFMANNPEQSDKIMAARAGVTPTEFKEFKEGTKMLDLAENKIAFGKGKDMTHLSYAAKEIKRFLGKTKTFPRSATISKLLNADFINKVST